MARRVSVDDIRQINEIYYKYKNYAETARQTGWSASTVRKYVDPNFTPIIEAEIIHFNFDSDMPKELSTALFEHVENWGDLCVYNDNEKLEIVDLWSEIVV